MNKEVSVVIPTYNRAYILEQTIPSYLQNNVGEIIIIDDCSTDNTRAVISAMQEKYSEIQYIRLSKNRKQAYAKNEGIKNAKYPYVFFGDDDSILTQGSISILLEELKYRNGSIIGAKALYMQSQEETKNVEEFIEKHMIYTNNITDIVDIKTLKVNFTLSTFEAVAVPFTQANFIVKTEFAKKVLFDTQYQGNAYREETDFLLRANKLGIEIYYQSKAVQINLPRDTVRSGGAHARNKLYWYISSMQNNWLFLRKNYLFIKGKYGLNRSIYTMQFQFVVDQLFLGSKNLLSLILKKIYDRK